MEFTRYDKGLRAPNELDASMIKTREIQLGIPADIGIKQIQQVQRAVEYGKLKGVNVIVTRIVK